MANNMGETASKHSRRRANPTSSIRAGFDYQDFWGLKLCGEWLANPKLYKWIQFETSPDEEDANKFYLDDIVCLDSYDQYHFYQVKHRQDPTNQWSWDDLLTAKRPKGTSLFSKWTNSLLTRLAQCKKAVFVTNGEASDEIKQYLMGESLDIEKIQTENQPLYTQIVNQIGTEEDLNCLFSILLFRFDQENQTDDELETNTRKFFHEKLNATYPGVTNLNHELRKESRRRYTRQLDIQTLRSWCEFDVPQSLDEHFAIPSDFEFFDYDTHKRLMVQIQKPDGGICVVYGKPGVGKSVYLSKLCDELNAKDVIVIKHHYHISPEDVNPQLRLNAHRIIEAIKSQFKLHEEMLGELANKNSKDIPLCDFVTTAASALAQQKRALVIIIDGLDHALRYAAKEELETFLHEICLPQRGVWLVLGMQVIAKMHLPQVVFDKCPENVWIEIKGLSKTAITKLIIKNETMLNLSNHSDQVTALADKLFIITSGNPLHLRYSLKQLKNISGTGPVTAYSCESLIPYGDDIERYYESLWLQISDHAKTLLLTISSVNFMFTKNQLVECVSLYAKNPADITNGFNAMAHLVTTNYRNQIRVYHNSFGRFLTNRPEMPEQRIAIKTNVKNWLQASGYEYLKWAELRIIEHELGDSDPILAIDRAWLINAMFYPSNPDQISRQLELAATVACEQENFSKGLHLSDLFSYYTNAIEFADEALEAVWGETLISNSESLAYVDLSQLPSRVLSDLVKTADSLGFVEITDEIIDILTNRLDEQEYRQNAAPQISVALLNAIPYDRSSSPRRVYEYVIQFRDLNATESLFETYVRRLLDLEQEANVEELLKLDFTGSESKVILSECAKYGFKNPGQDISKFFNGRKDLPPLCLLYQVMRGQSVILPALPDQDSFPEEITEHDSEERAKWKNFYRDNFIIGLIYALSGEIKDIEQWLQGSAGHWSKEAMSSLFQASTGVAAELTSSKLMYKTLHDAISKLEVLEWPRDRDSYNFQFAFKDAINLLFEDIVYLKEYLNADSTISETEYLRVIQKPEFFSKSDLTSLVLRLEKQLFSLELYTNIRDENIAGLANSIREFPERVREYGELARLTRLYEDMELSKTMLKKAVDNALGYGYHKDIYMFKVLDAIDSCARAGIDKKVIDDWISRIAPLIHEVGEYTDGDETNHLPLELGELLAKHDPDMLHKYYYWTADREDFYLAESLFKLVIKSLPFLEDVHTAIGSTAVDSDSFQTLRAFANNNAMASLAVNNIESYIGKVKGIKKTTSSLPSAEEPVIDYSEVGQDNLLDFLICNFDNRWDRDKYLVGWFSHNLETSSRECLFNAFAQVVQKYGPNNLSAELLDLIFPIVYEFNINQAFDILCQAQASDHGWEQYWTDKETAEKRWAFVKEKYPIRYLEFFKRSTNCKVPLARGVDYFLLFNDLERAKALAESGVEFVVSLMADMILQSPEWLDSVDAVSHLDILIQRLLWPSPLVRERAATAIARLLSESDDRQDVFKNLLAWISRQKMESVVAIGLLPVIKAFYIAKTPDKLGYLDINDLAASILISSVVIESLFDEISSVTEKAKPNLSALKDISIVPCDYSENAFFKKYINTLLAPIYMERANTIEIRSRQPFIRQWSYTADQIIEDEELVIDPDQFYFYGRGRDAEALMGFSSKISEAYRSAFLRVAQHYHHNGLIPTDFYEKYVYATLPVELSYWKIAPNRVPEWWPRLTNGTPSPDNRNRTIESISFVNSPEELIKGFNDRYLIAAEGAIRPSIIEARSDPSHSFILMAFGYCVEGAEIPSPEDIASSIFYSPKIITAPSKTLKPFNILEDKESHIPVNCEPTDIDDLSILPITARVVDLSIGLWQYFRDYNETFSLNPLMSDSLHYVPNDNGWELRDINGRVIVMHEDWLDGLRERYKVDMPIPHGHYLTIDKDFINDWLNSNGFRLGYVIKMTYRSGGYSYEKVKVYEDVKLLNVSKIIV